MHQNSIDVYIYADATPLNKFTNVTQSLSKNNISLLYSVNLLYYYARVDQIDSDGYCCVIIRISFHLIPYLLGIEKEIQD